MAIDPNTTAVVLIEYQNDFTTDGGVLHDAVADVMGQTDMLAHTRAGTLLKGYRGSDPLDADAVVDALVGLGRLATDLPDIVESVDVNPFVALPQGGMALDALIVLRRR